MKRLMMLFAAVSLVCFAMAGCSAGALSGSETEGAQDVRVITDMLGRQVEIPAKIERVAVAGSTARILTYAGCADKIAGVTEMDKTNDVNMPYSVVNDELFAKLPSVGAGGSKDISYEEELILLSPDVIFANKDKILPINCRRRQIFLWYAWPMKEFLPTVYMMLDPNW